MVLPVTNVMSNVHAPLPTTGTVAVNAWWNTPAEYELSDTVLFGAAAMSCAKDTSGVKNSGRCFHADTATSCCPAMSVMTWCCGAGHGVVAITGTTSRKYDVHGPSLASLGPIMQSERESAASNTSAYVRSVPAASGAVRVTDTSALLVSLLVLMEVWNGNCDAAVCSVMSKLLSCTMLLKKSS